MNNPNAEPVEYEDMCVSEKIAWLVDEAKLSARPHMTDAAHILAAQLVAAEELRDELVRALEPFSKFEFGENWAAHQMIKRFGDVIVLCGYDKSGTTTGIDVMYSNFVHARAALAKARTGGG